MTENTSTPAPATAGASTTLPKASSSPPASNAGNGGIDENEPVAGPGVEVEAFSENDNDSAYGEEVTQYTASLTSTIKNHIYENGRRYHSFQPASASSAVGYIAPNDDAENDRLDMHHHLARLLLKGKLITAPIGDNPQRILDLGTGTGIWAIDVGDDFPSAEILGVDLSPTQPNMVPPNVKFEVDDVESPWTHTKPFDYIHSRFMAASISNWPAYIAQMFKHTKPGGWVELQDWDLTIRSADESLPPDHPVYRYHHILYTAMRNIGRPYAPGPSLKEWVEAAGFESVTETIEAVPIGLWPKEKRYKEIGAWNLLCLVEGLESIALRLFVDVLGWSVEEVTVFLTEVRGACKDKKMHAQYTYYVVTAQKPLDQPTTQATDASTTDAALAATV